MLIARLIPVSESVVEELTHGGDWSSYLSNVREEQEAFCVAENVDEADRILSLGKMWMPVMSELLNEGKNGKEAFLGPIHLSGYGSIALIDNEKVQRIADGLNDLDIGGAEN